MLKVRDLKKIYKIGKNEIEILKGISFEIERGEMVSITGPSGAGKSTLLHLLGTLEKPSSGEIILNGKSISNETDFDLAKIRNEMIGFVFQFHFLLSEFTALENVMIPILIGGKSRTIAKEKAEILLSDMDLKERINHRPSELSGGEQQRVAIARALANDPQIVLADEPTGNLDSSNTNRICELLKEINSKTQQTFLIVTHNSVLSDGMDRKMPIVDGLINDQCLGGPNV
ncbi:MAG: ABC transporter ATP-binding protein [Nitrospinota bacterium]|nr:ABC transporter ATP-binding protein [Nitrospinota bacterium]